MSEPYFDPAVRAALETGAPTGEVRAENLAKVRANRLLLNDGILLSDKVTRTDITVEGPPGALELRLRIHRPKDAEGELPALFWMHGGGYVIGAPEQDDLRFDRWCQRFGLVGVVPEYRLAPEHPYPAAIEDSYAGLRWVKEQGAQLGIDPTRVGIGGPSGGGGLAAGLGLLVRDRGELDIDYQMLIYPMIDDRRTSVTANWTVPVWSPESNAFGWASYLGDLFGTDEVPPYAAAAREIHPSGLPPTYIMVGSLDGFADEDIDYAKRLNHAGVDVELHVYPGAPHGFEGFAPFTDVARQARRDINGWLARQLSKR